MVTDAGRILKTTETSLELLEYILDLDGASLTELADATDLAKSTIHSHLNTLMKYGYVTKENNQYYLGAKFCHLGEYVRNRKEIYRIAEDIVSNLADETDLDADFAVEEHGQIVSLYGDVTYREASHFLKDGRSFYVHSTASGKAIIAEYPEERVSDIINHWGLPEVTEQSITTTEGLFAELETIREQGYAINDEESIPGLWAVSMAVKDPRGDVCGALSLSGPAYLIDDETENTMVEILRRWVNEFETEIADSYDVITDDN